MSKQLPRDKGCFVCGKDNPFGLKLHFNIEDEHTVSAKFTPAEHLIGFKGMLHGGIMSAVLDDALCWAIYNSTGKFYVTSQLNVNFKKPGSMKGEFTVVGRAIRSDEKRSRKVEHAKAELKDASGHIVADAEGTFFQIPDHKVKELWDY